MALPKASATTCIYFQNLNGTTITNPGTWDQLCSNIIHLDIDISLWAEHKLDTQKPWVQSSLHTTARKHFGLGSYDLQTTSTPIQSHTSYKPGGVISLIHGSHHSRILEQGQDPLGRWLYTKLRQNMGSSVDNHATYQIVDIDPIHSGPTTYATQLFSQYLLQAQPKKLRQHHSDDLVQLVKQFQSMSELVILTGDLNEVLGLNTRGMTRLCQECNLVDPLIYRHGHLEFTTYQRGSKVIDYILIDPAFLPTITAFGYEPFGNHIISNHRGIYINKHIAMLWFNYTAFINDSVTQPFYQMIVSNCTLFPPQQAIA